VRYIGSCCDKRQTKAMSSSERSFWLDDVDSLLTDNSSEHARENAAGDRVLSSPRTHRCGSPSVT
jgi:hypothetical protein